MAAIYAVRAASPRVCQELAWNHTFMYSELRGWPGQRTRDVLNWHMRATLQGSIYKMGRMTSSIEYIVRSTLDIPIVLFEIILEYSGRYREPLHESSLRHLSAGPIAEPSLLFEVMNFLH